MSRVVLLAAALAACVAVPLRADEGEEDDGYVYFPLFPVEEDDGDGGESGVAAKDEKEKLVELKGNDADAIKPNLDRYGMRAFTCDFDGEKWGCLLYTPKGAGAKPLPMIVHIPGMGEIGEDLSNQFHQGLVFDIVTSPEFQKKHPCHLLAVSPPSDTGTYYGSVPGQPNRPQRRTFAIVEKVCAVVGKTPVDKDRIYVTGFSFGGDAAYMMAVSYPERFAAAMPISAIAPSSSFISEKRPGNFWHLCNDGDAVGSGSALSAAQKLKEHVNAAGGDFRLSVYPATEGHDAWTTAWTEGEVWDWMFSKSLSAPKAKSRAAAKVDSNLAPVSLVGAKCTATVPAADEEHNETRPLDFLRRTYYEPASAFGRSDWWQVELEKPVSGRVVVKSGNGNGGKLLKSGYVELSGNGKTWRRGGVFSKTDGVAEFRAGTPFRFLRVRSSQKESEPFAINLLSVYPVR